MSEFLIELYVARGDRGTAARARRAVDRLAASDPSVRLVRTLVVPEDETCFLLVEAASADAVHCAAGHARLRYERITEVVSPTCSTGVPG